MEAPQEYSIDPDLIAGLVDHPLWEGTDDEFAAYVHEAFAVPTSFSVVTIAGRTPSGRCAVAMGGEDGALVFVITPNPPTTTHVAPSIVGPLCSDQDVIDRAKASSGDANMSALTTLALRHLSPDVVLDLFAPLPTH